VVDPHGVRIVGPDASWSLDGVVVEATVVERHAVVDAPAVGAAGLSRCLKNGPSGRRGTHGCPTHATVRYEDGD
jgi:hypothetical protein